MKIEKAQNCKLVEKRHEDAGHDCWGNFEYTTIHYVLIEGMERVVMNGDYIVHDDKIVYCILSGSTISRIRDSENRYERTGFYTDIEVKAYMKGLNASKRKK